MAAGVTDRLWEIEDIVRLVDEAAPKPGPRGPCKTKKFKPTHYRLAGGVPVRDPGVRGAAVGDVRIYVSGGKGVLPVVTTTTNRSTPHVPASCDDHEPTPGL